MQLIEFLKRAWCAVRSNPGFVAFEGGASGVVVDWICAGRLDFTAASLRQLGTSVLIGGITAVRLLYRPAPGSTTTPNPEPKE